VNEDSINYLQVPPNNAAIRIYVVTRQCCVFRCRSRDGNSRVRSRKETRTKAKVLAFFRNRATVCRHNNIGVFHMYFDS